MKINILLSVIILVMFTKCIKFNDNISKDYRMLVKTFNIGDTIYYKSNLNDYDTIRISSIDSFSTKQGPDNFPFKNINIRTEYLPKNSWNFGYDLRKSNNKYDSIVNDKFIELTKSVFNNNLNQPKYEVYAKYRDFVGQFKEGNLKINKIDTIVAQVENGLDILEEYPVIEIYWSVEKGMIGYKKKDGQIYKLVENIPAKSSITKNN